MADVKAYNTGLTEEQLAEAFRRALNDLTDEQITELIAGKQDTLTFDSTPTESSENPVTSGGVYSGLSAKIPLSLGTRITDPDPDNGEYADLFTLPVGKYYRWENITNTQNIPADLTTAFYCEIVSTIIATRRQIRLYPSTDSTSGSFYTCLETASGYGNWYKYTGTAVT